VKHIIAEVHTVVPNLIWEHNDLVVREPINLGNFQHLTQSQEFELIISHDSNQEITECGFYISPFSKNYDASFSAIKDYERMLWFANNYEDFGLSIRQQYEVTGQFDGHDGIRLLDFEREERTDIFSGSSIEILSGDALGETAEIASYNPKNQIFLLASDFSANVKDTNYKIVIDRTQYFKTGQGSDYTTAIPLVYRGGVIERLDTAIVTIKLKIPNFAQSAGNFLFDFDMQFTSLEEE